MDILLIRYNWDSLIFFNWKRLTGFLFSRPKCCFWGLLLLRRFYIHYQFLWLNLFIFRRNLRRPSWWRGRFRGHQRIPQSGSHLFVCFDILKKLKIFHFISQFEWLRPEIVLISLFWLVWRFSLFFGGILISSLFLGSATNLLFVFIVE